MLFATVTTECGDDYEVVYCKWLDHALSGIERLTLPLSTTFPLHQWAVAYMGLKPPRGAWYASASFGIVDASKVLNWEPIVQIGLRSWRPTSAYTSRLGVGWWRADAPESERRAYAAAMRRCSGGSERKPAGVGQPLFANNVHVWSFGTA